MRVGIVGVGVVGQRRARLALSAGDTVVGVTDTDVDRANSVGAQIGVPAVRDLEALLQRGVDAVVIATPHLHLARLTRSVLLADAHVFCEKPGATRASDLRENACIAVDRGLTLQVGYTHPHLEHISEALTAVSSGELGEINSVRMFLGNGARVGFESEWRSDVSQAGGGVLMDLGVHLIHIALTLFTDVRFVGHVACMPKNNMGKSSGEADSMIILQADSGSAISLASSWTQWANTFTLDISSSETLVEVRGLGGAKYSETFVRKSSRSLNGRRPDALVRVPADTASADAWVREWDVFRQSVASSKSNTAHLRSVVRTLEIVEEAYECLV